MRLLIKKRNPIRIEFGIIYGGIALLMMCIARLLPVLSFAPSCAFKGFTGFPCPTCGSTRSVVFLSHGDLVSAFAMNPLTTLCMFIAVLYFLSSVINMVFDLPRISLMFTDIEKNVVRAGAAILLLAQWIYLIVVF